MITGIVVRDRLRQRGRVGEVVVLAVEAVGPGRRFHRPVMISSCSASRPNRLAGNGMPYAACSRSNQPAPRPSSTRPPDIWSTCATWIARIPGWRKVADETSVPSLMRLVSRARPARVVQESVGPGQAVARAHPQVVVGAEEGVEAEVLGGLGDGELVVVGGALLGLDEDAQIHVLHPHTGRAPHVARARRSLALRRGSDVRPWFS